MLVIVVLVVMAATAVHVCRTLFPARALFAEFGVPFTAPWLVCLFPLAPLAWLATRDYAGWLPGVAAAVVCYVPALVATGRARAAFERTGTDRTEKVLHALSLARVVAWGGLAHLAWELASTLMP